MTNLEALNQALKKIPAAEVQSPDRPVAIFVQQNHDLLSTLEGEVLEALSKVGFKAEQLEDYRAAVGALQAAESSWQASRKTRSPEELVALEKDADLLRRDFIAACRWNLRDDRNVQAVLNHVQEGEGVADLALDLETLATLVANGVDAFANDATFDASVNVESARMKASEVRQAFSLEKADDTAAEMLDLRDRAFTWLDSFWDDTRRAGRYVFRKDATRLAHFRDDYRNQAVRRQRRGRAAVTLSPVNQES